MQVEEVAVKGGSSIHPYWYVTSFKLAYRQSSQGSMMDVIDESNDVRVFDTDFAGLGTEHVFLFTLDTMHARAVRLNVLTYFNFIGLRWELYGCNVQRKKR